VRVRARITSLLFPRATVLNRSSAHFDRHSETRFDDSGDQSHPCAGFKKPSSSSHRDAPNRKQQSCSRYSRRFSDHTEWRSRSSTLW